MPVGITLLTYAVLGSLVMLLTVGGALAAPMLMKMAAPGGEPPRMPMVLLAFVVTGGALSVGLGVLLGVGGLGVVAQRRVGQQGAALQPRDPGHVVGGDLRLRDARQEALHPLGPERAADMEPDIGVEGTPAA